MRILHSTLVALAAVLATGNGRSRRHNNTYYGGG